MTWHRLNVLATWAVWLGITGFGGYVMASNATTWWNWVLLPFEIILLDLGAWLLWNLVGAEVWYGWTGQEEKLWDKRVRDYLDQRGY